MRLSFLPKEEKFYEDFNHQAELIAQGSAAFKHLVNNWDDRAASLKRINDLEHECDEIVHGIAHRLNKTFVTPIDREDIHSLATRLDDIIDFIQGAAVRMELFKIKTITPECIELVQILDESVAKVQVGMKRLSKFKEISILRKELQALEKAGDRKYRQAIADLFHDGADPLNVIKWKEIYDIIETAIDNCEDVFDVIESVILKHA